MRENSTEAVAIPALLKQALVQLDRNDTTRAEELLALILAGDPDNPSALQLMGIARRMQGRFPEAEELFRRSLAVDPNQAQVHHNLGNLLRQLERYADSIAAQREALRLKPNYAEAHLNLALALSGLKDHAGAEKSCRDALRVQPGYLFAKQTLAAELNAQGRPHEAERLLRQALALGVRDPRQVAAFEHNLAVALKMQRRYVEALRLFDSAQVKVPEMPSVDYNRGNTLQHMGRLEEAAAFYRRAVARDPLDLAAHRDLNQLLYRLGDDQNFLKSFDQAALFVPEAGVLSLQKANFLHLKGDFEAASEAFEQAARIHPDAVAAHDGLALALAQLGQFDRALAEHEIAARLAPNRSPIWRNYAQTHLMMRDAKKALPLAEWALSLEPDSQIALAIWGIAARLSGQSREEDVNDSEALVRVYEIAPPEGYGSVEDFNRDLNAYLDRLHLDRRECIDQTLRTGTQTLDELFGRGHAPVELLRARIDDAVADYISRMPEDAEHPLYRRRKTGFGYAASWSSRLRDCGFHTNHVHSKGWISSAYYVAVPDAVDDPARKEGWIKFGEPNFDCGLGDAVRRTVKPKPGTLVLFPSYFWHGTVPFHSTQMRTTIAFDAVPAG
ncbi:MAG TPA: tetratricopeptide repeat protein [Rhizomicrobium sp.]|jgi:tetratricopeptide (TPR) repeat protein